MTRVCGSGVVSCLALLSCASLLSSLGFVLIRILFLADNDNSDNGLKNECDLDKHVITKTVFSN